MDYISFVKSKYKLIIKGIIFIGILYGVGVTIFHVTTRSFGEKILMIGFFILNVIVYAFIVVHSQLYVFNSNILSLGVKRLTIMLSVLLTILSPFLLNVLSDNVILTLFISFIGFWLLAAASTWVYNGFSTDSKQD